MAEPQGGHVAAPRSPLALVLVRSAATMPRLAFVEEEAAKAEAGDIRRRGIVE